MLQLIKCRLLYVLQERINRRNRRRLSQCNSYSQTIIANNCIGGYIYHWLRLRFDSPTINLFIPPPDYIKMLSNFDVYFDPNATITEVESDRNYPVGDIYGCKIHFMHYKSFDEAVKKWRDRCSRINKDSLCVMMTDRDGCSVNDMKQFDSLNYEKKVLFTNTAHDDIHCAVYIKGFETMDSVGQLQERMNITGKRYIDQFDYVEFLKRE